MKANRANVLLWIALFIVVIMVSHFLSDGDFSFLLVYYDVICVMSRPLLV